MFVVVEGAVNSRSTQKLHNFGNNARLQGFCFTSSEMYNKIDAPAKNKQHLENTSTTLLSASGEIFNDIHFTPRKI